MGGGIYTMKITNLFFVTVMTVLFITGPVYSQKFSNSYIEFSKPDTWDCRKEGGQDICQPVNPNQRPEAIIVMAAKYKGPDDELKDYMAKLKEKRTIKDTTGKEYVSEEQYTKWNTILGTIWIDSQHLNREVPGFITRYLATVQKGVGIVLTFSAHKEKFDKYSPDFYQMISNLRISENIPAPVETKDITKLGPGIMLGGDISKEKAKGAAPEVVDIKVEEESDLMTYLGIGAVILLLVLVIMKRRKRKGKK
jgi:hypothetical protein